MDNCSKCKIISALDNAWYALCAQYNDTPCDEIRHAMNLLAKIINKTKAEFIELNKEKEQEQITLDDWLDFLNQFN
jgi:hypothetical protein